MPRVMTDCRKVPSVSNCSLVIAGERDEVIRAAVIHAVDVHEHEDTPELRRMIESSLEPEPSALSGAASTEEVRA